MDQPSTLEEQLLTSDSGELSVNNLYSPEPDESVTALIKLHAWWYVPMVLVAMVESYLSLQLAADDPIPNLINSSAVPVQFNNLTWGNTTTPVAFFKQTLCFSVSGISADPLLVGSTLCATGFVSNLVKLPLIRSYYGFVLSYFRELAAKPKAFVVEPTKKIILPIFSLAAALFLAVDVAVEINQRFRTLPAVLRGGIACVFGLCWLLQNAFSLSAVWLENALAPFEEKQRVPRWLAVLLCIGSVCVLTRLLLTTLRLINGGWPVVGTLAVMGVLGLACLVEIGDAVRFSLGDKHKVHIQRQPTSIGQAVCLQSCRMGLLWSAFALLVIEHFSMLAADFMVVRLGDPGVVAVTVIGITLTVFAAVSEVLFHTRSWSMMLDCAFARVCCRRRRKSSVVVPVDKKKKSSRNWDQSVFDPGLIDRSRQSVATEGGWHSKRVVRKLSYSTANG